MGWACSSCRGPRQGPQMPFFRKRQSFPGQNRPTNPGGSSTSAVPDAGALTASRPEKRHKWYIRLARQELKGWAPIITGNAVVIYFLVMGIVLLALGIPILVGSHGVKEFTVNYDDVGQLASRTDFDAKRDYLYSQGGSGTTGTKTIRVTANMKQPVRIVYSAEPALLLSGWCMVWCRRRMALLLPVCSIRDHRHALLTGT